MREESHIIKKVGTEISSRDDLHLFNSGGLSGYRDLVNDSKYSIVGMIKVGVKTLYVVVGVNMKTISPAWLIFLFSKI
jgi:hypothetical protein